jgi:hypothetical protein
MFAIQDYFPVAQAHESVFRNVLRDLVANRAKRPGGMFVPKDLDPEAPLATLYEKYSTGDRQGIFSISGFTVVGEVSTISFEDVAPLSGGGASLTYCIKGESVEYQGPLYFMLS